ncbi:MAG: tRNA(His) guanylyltransferase Thg1 family protein [Methanotrichaceae archaeon]|jgi:tRNA(His) 5'-end guanylyltransferase
MQRNSGKTASWEIYSNLKARTPLVARADGRGFKKILESCKKPYDMDFARSMIDATVKLFEDSGLTPSLAFTFSDEISLIFLEAPFSGRVEKIDSVIAGLLSGALSMALGRVVSMDCRVVSVCRAEIVEYLVDRQDETWRNHVFSYGFYMLLKDGLTNTQAMDQLRNMREFEIHELVFRKGVNLAKTPAWERRGMLVYRTGGELVQNWDLPLFKSEEGQRLIDQLIVGN